MTKHYLKIGQNLVELEKYERREEITGAVCFIILILGVMGFLLFIE